MKTKMFHKGDVVKLTSKFCRYTGQPADVQKMIFEVLDCIPLAHTPRNTVTLVGPSGAKLKALDSNLRLIKRGS